MDLRYAKPLQEIYENFLKAIQDAEGLGGPSTDKIELMDKISAEAAQRSLRSSNVPF